MASDSSSSSSYAKIRKVKCDETKPFCLRCSKTGRACDGYLDPRALTSRRRLKDISPHYHVLAPLLENSTPEETRSFYFFQNVTAPCLSGDFDSFFWTTYVLQISQSEPTVRHAVLAVSSLHEGFTSAPCAGDTTRSFTLQQYNKAIACLLDQMNSHSAKPLASLLTCVLFVCIEYLQGKYQESLIHLEQGQQLLIRLDQQANNPEMEYIVRYIVPLYTRLSLASFLFGVDSIPTPNFLRSHGEIPDTFESIDDLQASVHEFTEQAFHFTRKAQPVKNNSVSIPRETTQMLEVEQERLLSRLVKLNVAFSLFRASVGSRHGPKNALLVLQIYLHAQHIWISTALSSSEVVYDDYLSSFAAIVPLAAIYLDLEAASQHQSTFATPAEPPQYPPENGQEMSGQSGSLTFERRIIAPLYYVAIKCRHPLIRRSALDLLRRSPFKRENLWRASVLGSLSGHIVSLEESWAHGQNRRATLGPSHSPHGSYMPHGEVYHATQSSGMALPQDTRQDDPHPDISLHNVAMSTEETTLGIPTNSAVSPFPELDFEDFGDDQPMESVVDPALHTSLNSSLDRAPSLVPLIDGCSSSSAVELAMPILSPPSNDTPIWQQEHPQQQGYRDHRTYQPTSNRKSATTYLTPALKGRHRGPMADTIGLAQEITRISIGSKRHQHYAHRWSPNSTRILLWFLFPKAWPQRRHSGCRRS
ncbi:hypothetical protein VSDG_04425 [Cytospora chrysosperma]|uniref:Zn(2)-C6 fungal-type domain-containing protein n=1 Tax=Cytospora chrysosperma TaxID=252740 RepID=A0A423W4P2_CYTCH|nr:hypothetical protein VSDG_04425 [Valsa sordida]